MRIGKQYFGFSDKEGNKLNTIVIDIFGFIIMITKKTKNENKPDNKR